MNYSKSAPFQGDPDKAIVSTFAFLTSIGMRITSKTPASLEAVPGGYYSTCPHTFMSLDRIHLHVTHDRVSLQADLVSLMRYSQLASFCMILIYILSLIPIVLWCFSSSRKPSDTSLGLCWLMLLGLPVFAWAARRQATRPFLPVHQLLDTLLLNCVAAGQGTYHQPVS